MSATVAIASVRQTETPKPARSDRRLQPDRVLKRLRLSALEEHRLRIRLRDIAPSETWVDAQFVTLTEITRFGRTITGSFHNPAVFPPGGARRTTMKWCRRCRRYTPANCMHLIERRRVRGGDVISATLRCDDCHIAIDESVHRELYEAFPHLRPAGSLSFVKLRELYAERRHAR